MNGVQFMPCQITSWREAPSGIHAVSPRESGLPVVFKRLPPIVNEPVANMLLAAIVYWRKCLVYFRNQISQQVILRVQDVVNLLRTDYEPTDKSVKSRSVVSAMISPPDPGSDTALIDQQFQSAKLASARAALVLGRLAADHRRAAAPARQGPSHPDGGRLRPWPTSARSWVARWSDLMPGHAASWPRELWRP